MTKLWRTAFKLRYCVYFRHTLSALTSFLSFPVWQV